MTALRAIVLTLFPEMFPGPLAHSLAGKALSEGLWTLQTLNIRDFAEGKHANVDDTPYGGGAGMVLRADVVGRAIDAARELLPDATLIHFTPRGTPLTQALVRGLVSLTSEPLSRAHPHPSPPPSRGREFARLTSRAQALRKNPTEAEKKLWAILRHKQLAGYKFRRQQQIGPYIVDFVCFDSGLILEADGGQQAEEQKTYDDRRTDFLNAEGFTVLRFWNHDILQNPEGIYEQIKAYIASPSPSRGEGQGGGATTAPSLILLCGRFEGIDERINTHYQPLEVSLGDFVMFGGEVAAFALLEAALRQCSGALGNPQTLDEESFSIGKNSALLLEYPHYTKPPSWKGLSVPEILVSGHHANISQWRKEQAEIATQTRRPDLWDAYRQTQIKE